MSMSEKPKQKFNFFDNTRLGRLLKPMHFTGPIAFNIAVTVFIVLITLIFTEVFLPRVGRSLFILSEVRVTGPTELCPGDTLDFEFDVNVKEVGTYNLWMSTWKVDPPPSTIIFSEFQPFVIGSPRQFLIPRKWRVPTNYVDPADSTEKPLLPGAYTRDISVTAEGRDTRNHPLLVAFNIKKDCKKNK